MTDADIQKLIEDLDIISKDLLIKRNEFDDNYDDVIDSITALTESLDLIYLSNEQL